MKRLSAALLCVLWATPTASAYPLDAYEDTGIARLEAFRLVQDGVMPGIILYWGAQLYRPEIALRLKDKPGFALPAPDPELNARITSILGEDAPGYGVVILDLSDPDNPRYAENNPESLQNPGSVGKILVALGWFQALADLYPDDVEARRKLLRETQVTASAFIRNDSHIVPFWTPGEPRYERRPIAEGDTANLYTWMDWMLSSSSNAAASEMQAQLVLLKAFGTAYPPSAADAEAYFRVTPRAKLSKLFLDAIRTPVTRNGLDIAKLRQGSFFTRTGKQRVSGTSSRATPLELLRFMLLMEQGKLVDEWSSLEMKRLLYLTDKRIRYASPPSLWDWAVYFKSGSWYKCKAEKGFTCDKYMGNVFNYMNSVTMVESVDQEKEIHYIAVVLSNVLRKNSSLMHRELSTRVHEAILNLHGMEAVDPTKPKEGTKDDWQGEPDDMPDEEAADDESPGDASPDDETPED